MIITAFSSFTSLRYH